MNPPCDATVVKSRPTMHQAVIAAAVLTILGINLLWLSHSPLPPARVIPGPGTKPGAVTGPGTLQTMRPADPGNPAVNRPAITVSLPYEVALDSQFIDTYNDMIRFWGSGIEIADAGRLVFSRGARRDILSSQGFHESTASAFQSAEPANPSP